MQKTQWVVSANRSILWSLVVMLCCGCLSPHQVSSGTRPNIVLILCDDMGWSDLGCYGGEVQTPYLNQLAHEGLRFTHCYNNAKCTTTRASLMTGLYPRQGGDHLLGEAMVTMAEALKKVGYQTAMSGKWHLGSQFPLRPVDRGFDHFYGLLDGACHYFDPSKPDPDFKGHRVRVFVDGEEPVTTFPSDFYTTDAFADRACQQIRQMAELEAPFFMHLAFTAPHYPLHAFREDVEDYQGVYKEGWESLRLKRHQRQISMGLVDPGWRLPERDPEVEPWKDQTHASWQSQRMATYAAMIDRMDRGIGKVLQTLTETGLEQDTLVVFLSDNGGCAEVYSQDLPEHQPGSGDSYMTCGPGWAFAQNTPFRRFKTWLHEGGIATPMIVRWPTRIAPNTVSSQVCHIIDLMPTFLEVAQGTYPTQYRGRPIIPCEGVSLTPIFSGQSLPGSRVLWWEYRGSRAVREGPWKLVRDRKRPDWELYHMEHDRTETNDLAKQYPEKVTQMAKSWQGWHTRMESP